MKENKPYRLISYKTIAPYLHANENRSSKLVSYAGLGLGVLLLLCCLQMFVNINQLLNEKNARKDGFDFISVTKTITNQNMGQDNRFTDADIAELAAQPFISDVSPLVSNQFRAKVSAGSVIPFSTDLFLESVKDEFLDTLPPSFSWKEGQLEVPIIFSADFLEMYNVFAPAQDLPQISASSISTINVVLECYSAFGVQSFRGRIVAVSDRINSVLVPENFLSWANKTYGNATKVPAARVYLKTSDANNPELLKFIESKNYHVNKDRTKFGRVKQILQAVVSGLGGFAILVILLAMLLFSFYLRLMIEKSKNNLQLLVTLGYSPAWLTITVTRTRIPVYVSIILIALFIAALFQFSFQHYVFDNRPELSPWLHWGVVVAAGILLMLCVVVNYRLVKQLLYKL